MWGKWNAIGFIICAILLVVAVFVVAGLLFASFDAESRNTLFQSPRPTLPAGTPTCEVFLPFVQKAGTPGAPTPRPTLEGK